MNVKNEDKELPLHWNHSWDHFGQAQQELVHQEAFPTYNFHQHPPKRKNMSTNNEVFVLSWHPH